jgi:hypothetical protein
MQKNDELSRPVVIGGVGGSGTRVVAEIIKHLGFYIGDDLDPAKDNLWFLLLFKRPRWFRQVKYDNHQVFTGLSLLSKVMLARSGIQWPELLFLIRAAIEISFYGHNHKRDGRGYWPWLRAWNMVVKRSRTSPDQNRWGWKEPNSHIFLNYLADYFTNLKYIHTIRHGLDMAFSDNQQQLYNWGPNFGLPMPQTKLEEPASSLKYWIKSNNRVMKIGQKLGDHKFLVVNFDHLCISPESEIQKILSFLNVEPGVDDLETLIRIPKIPKSLGRYREYDISQFDPADLIELENLGFSVTANDR